MPVAVEIDEAGRRRLAEAYRKAKRVGDGKTIPRLLRRHLRVAGGPALRSARASARSLPAARRYSSQGLRGSTARALGLQVKLTGDPMMRIRVQRKTTILGSAVMLPRHMNYGQWRHPVYGSNREVIQTSRKAWFDDRMRAEADNVGNEVMKVIGEVEKMLET